MNSERGDHNGALLLFRGRAGFEPTRAHDRFAESLALYNLAKPEPRSATRNRHLPGSVPLDVGESLCTDVASLDSRASIWRRDRADPSSRSIFDELDHRSPASGYDALAFDASERLAPAPFLMDWHRQERESDKVPMRALLKVNGSSHVRSSLWPPDGSRSSK